VDQKRAKHDNFAPFWAIALAIFGSVGLSTVWFDLGPFWKGYVLDITGPAWNYILFRGLFTSYAENAWTRFFTPKRTFLIFISVCIGIEMAQYFEIYDSTFDPLDLIAYMSLLIPVFILDLRQTREKPIH
jgi:hypothetical protein